MSKQDRTPVKNLTLNKGEDYSATGDFFDDFGNNIDISSDTFRAEVREYDDGPVLATFTFTIFQDDDDIDPNTGQGKWKYERSMSQTIINAMTVKTAVWDQFQEFLDGKSSKNLKGDVQVIGNITDPTV